MNRTGADSLSPAERKVLRLIHARVTGTKELARRLNIAGPTVKTQIASAMRKLGASSRAQAAAMLAAAEAHHPQGIKPPRRIDFSPVSADPIDRQVGASETAVHEERPFFDLSPPDGGSPELRQKIGDLNVAVRVLVIATIAIAAAVLVLIIIPVSDRAEVVGKHVAVAPCGKTAWGDEKCRKHVSNLLTRSPGRSSQQSATR